MTYELMCFGEFNPDNKRCIVCVDSGKCEYEYVLNLDSEKRLEYLKEKE